MKTTQDFLNAAEEARLEFVQANKAALDYAGCKPSKQLKKDAEFLKLASKMVNAKKLWYDLNAAALIQARTEKAQSILN